MKSTDKNTPFPLVLSGVSAVVAIAVAVLVAPMASDGAAHAETPAGNGAPAGEEVRVAGEAGGWFTAEQIAHGKSVYESRCSDCHDNDIVSKYATWPLSAQNMVDMIISMGMPLDNPGGLSPQQYADIVAYVFNSAGLPEGAEVTAGSPEMNEIKLR